MVDDDARSLRLSEFSGLPVSFIFACDGDETISSALVSGAADYNVKPFPATGLELRHRRGAGPRPRHSDPHRSRRHAAPDP